MLSQVEYSEAQKLFHGSIPRVMGTKLDLVTVGTDRVLIEPVWEELCAYAERLDSILNRFDSQSEVARFNAMEDRRAVSMSSELSELTSLGVEYWNRTEGLFDICRGRMTALNFNEDGSVSVSDPDLKLDFGGLAKGYFMKMVDEKLRKAGVRSAFVDFGNSAILGVGRHPFGDSWIVSLPNPYSGSVVAELRVCDRAISTSGNAPGYTGHIVHPTTGKACIDRKMVTVVSANPLDAEVLSTVMMLADKGQEIRIRRSFPDAQINTYSL